MMKIPTHLSWRLYAIGLLVLFLLFLSVPVIAEIGRPGEIPPLMAIGGPLLEWVDLERPDLEPVRTLLKEGKQKEALQALLLHFRNSDRPRLFERKLEPDSFPDTTIADRALQFEITINDATTVLQSWEQTNPNNKNWNYIMQRHTWWLDVARAYFDTGNESYAAFLNDVVLDWCLSHPRPDATTQRSRLSGFRRPREGAWRTLDIGIRLRDTWPEIFLYIRDSSSFTDEALAAFLRSCHQQAEYLVEHPKVAKWLLVESCGLLTTAVMYPEFYKASGWLDTANSRLVGLANEQIQPDGSHIGGSPSYLFTCLHAFADVVHLQRINDLYAPESLYETVVRGIWYSIGIAEPGLYLPALNDCDRLYLPDLLNDFGPALPDLPEFSYIRTERSEGYPPPLTNLYYPYAGHFAFRDSWEPDSQYAFFDVGIYGNAAAHEDRLQFGFSAYGETFLADTGRSAYLDKPEGRYFAGTEAHNCILVDGVGQNVRAEGPNVWVNRSPLEWPSSVDDYVKWAQASFEGPWMARKPLKIRWTRRVAFAPPSGLTAGCCVISDLVEGEGKHRIDQLLNFLPGQASVDQGSGRVYFMRNTAQLMILVLAEEEVDISLAEGRESPFRGWFAPRFGVLEPAPSVRVAGEARLPVTRHLLLVPYRLGEKPPVLSASVEKDRVVCETIGGTLEIPVGFLKPAEDETSTDFPRP